MASRLSPCILVTYFLRLPDLQKVMTDMTVDEPAEITTLQSVKGMLKVIDSITIKDSGKYLTWEGKTLPW